MIKKNKFDTVILAAGLGVRMKSATPKVFHRICDRPILWWVVRSAVMAGSSSVIVVTRKDFYQRTKSEVLSWAEECGWQKTGFDFAVQAKQLGSGDALKSALKFLSKKNEHLLVLSGDAPLIREETIRNFVSSALSSGSKNFAAAVLASNIDDPSGYGRIVREPHNRDFLRIVEEKDATPQEKAIKEINVGAYIFAKNYLYDALKKIRPENAKKEYYITDTFEILRSQSLLVRAIPAAEPSEALGINNRWELYEAEKILRLIINKDIMIKSGVTLIDAERVYIGPDVKIGGDTVIYPGVMIKGKSIIGKNCVIGSGSYIKNSYIGNDVKIRASYIYDSHISDDVLIGPFAHIRPGTVIHKGSRVGNFTEIKKSFVGANTKISHLAYIGDAELSGDINIGAGAITCNYDGVNKHKTIIGRGSFIGSNVNLVAPVTVGKNVLIGAGSTITKDIPDNTLAIERSAQIHKPNKKLLK